MARSDASKPISKADLLEVKREALASPRKRPLAIHADCCSAPLRAVQNAMQHLQKKRQRLSVEDFGKYLESKTGRPETGLMVLSHTVRSDWTSVVFTIIDLPHEFVRVYAATAQPMSLVAQTDFTGELVVQF